MSGNPLTETEITSLIEHSSLPIILVEGREDMSIYSWLASGRLPGGVEILPCSGRTTLLGVFERRHEFADKSVAFVADRDMWLFSGVPTCYLDVVWTHGFSVENDVLSSSLVDRLFSASEKEEFRKLARELCIWFAQEVTEYLDGRHAVLDVHINQLIPLKSQTLDPSYSARRRYRASSSKELLRRIQAKPKQMVRGKQILQLYVRILDAPSRRARYRTHSVLEIALKGCLGRSLRDMRQEVLSRLTGQQRTVEPLKKS
jgi:hypothetical protein